MKKSWLELLEEDHKDLIGLTPESSLPIELEDRERNTDKKMRDIKRVKRWQRQLRSYKALQARKNNLARTRV